MSIKAQYKGHCKICDQPWEPGAHIGRWLGDEVHFICRQGEIERRSAAGAVEELPEARGWADRPQMTAGKKGRRRYVSIGAMSWQDGRSQNGRFQSKPDPT